MEGELQKRIKQANMVHENLSYEDQKENTECVFVIQKEPLDLVSTIEMLEIAEEAKKDLNLEHIREVMKNYPEREWWIVLEPLVTKLAKWFGK